jgi:hypothetical protein
MNKEKLTMMELLITHEPPIHACLCVCGVKNGNLPLPVDLLHERMLHAPPILITSE